MKVKRWVALGAIAVLVVGVLGVFGTRAFAASGKLPEGLQNLRAEAQERLGGPKATETVNDGAEAGDTGGETADKAGENGEDVGAADQTPLLSGSIAVSETVDTSHDATDAAALAGLAKITVEQAQAAALAANPGTTVVKAELGAEAGWLVYSVELNNGTEVIVDAGNSAILATDSSDVNEAAETEGTGD